jgi:hypothetical protein
MKMETAIALAERQESCWPRLLRPRETNRREQGITEPLNVEQRNIIEEILCDLLIDAVVREGLWDTRRKQDGQDQAKAS